MFRRNMFSAALAIGLAAALPVAAQDSAPQNSQRTTSGGRYDQQIQADLGKKFSGKKEFQNVRYSVEDGIVALSGNVELYAHKTKADQRAHDVDHVQSLSNQIKVAGPQVADAELHQKLADKLRYDRIGYGIMFNNLKLGVRNGMVELAGNVSDSAAHASAVALVANLPGVKGIRDEIDVAPASNFDNDLRISLARAIYGDPTFTMYANDPQAPIRIVVDKGHVTLEGVVNSQVDKQLAQAKAASVPGSFSVTNNLVVAGKESAKK